MIKKIFFLLLSFEFCVSSFAYAGNDLAVVCNTSGCQKSHNLPLFNESNIYPGYLARQILTVQNDRNGDCQLNISALNQNPVQSILPDRIFLEVTGSNQGSYADTLSQFYITPSRSLGIINSGTTAVFTWQAQFDREAGNEYQNISSVFDLDLNFSCTEPSPQVLSASTASSNGPTTCSKSTPNTTDIYEIKDNNDGTALIRWHNVLGEFTHYLIAYGPDRNTILYGAPNVGADNKYLVQGLTPGARYCFYVKAVNGCAPGPASNVHCINPGAAPGTAVPAGFNPGVLGAQTSITPTPSAAPQSIELGTVQGATTSCARKWLPILFIFVLIINLIKFNYVLSFVLCVLSFLIDWYMLRSRCCLVNPIFCQYFWVGNILSYLLPFVFKKNRK